MDIVVISIVALLASALTLFSGFGLGTLLMPIIAIFFPVDMAIAMTAMAHLANNIFKSILLGRKADRSVLLSFGLPAIGAAFAGAIVLGWLSGVPPLFGYDAFGKRVEVHALNLTVGTLIMVFVLLEMSSRFSSVSLDRKYLPWGGIVSGFFGGLSGHQGAFRSMFLIKSGLDKDVFVATGVMLAVMVDLSRLPVYGYEIARHHSAIEWPAVIAASVSAFVGAYAGTRLLKKATIGIIRVAVSVLLFLVSVGLISGAL